MSSNWNEDLAADNLVAIDGVDNVTRKELEQTTLKQSLTSDELAVAIRAIINSQTSGQTSEQVVERIQQLIDGNITISGNEIREVNDCCVRKPSPLNEYLRQDFPYGVCHVDASLMLVDANHHFYTMFEMVTTSQAINLQQLFVKPTQLKKLLSDAKTLAVVKDRRLKGLTLSKQKFICQLKVHVLGDVEQPGFVVMIRDVTEDVANKEKLSLANQMIHDVIEAMPARIYWKDRDFNYIGCNHLFANDFGFESVNELLQQSNFSFENESDKAHYRNIEHAILHNNISFHTQERKLQLANGDSIWVHEFLYPLKDAQNVTYGVIGSYEDISHIKRTEAENTRLSDSLQQAQKMDSLGRLVGGIAHDFNNFLSVILGYTQLLRLRSDLPSEQDEYLFKIEDASSKAKHLTEKLLMFGRKQAISPTRVELVTQLKTSLDTFSSLLSEETSVEFYGPTNRIVVEADKSQLEQVLLNLLVNGRDAISEKTFAVDEQRRLSVNVSITRNHHSKNKPAQHGYACIAVKDNGTGMDEHTLEHLFDPFFSTKDEMGTGLGLATVFGIVSQNDGDINVESSLGHGTTVSVYWPLVAASSDAISFTSDNNIQYVPMTEDKGLICVVEDQQDVRELTSSILTSHGYDVLAFENGNELDLCLKSEPRRPILLITDVILKNAEHGKNVADKFNRQYPSVPVLYMSGYDNNVIAKRGIILQGIDYLQKPFSINDLIGKVRSVLRQRTLSNQR